MNTAQNGKNSKNRLRGESLTAYGESKLWDNMKSGSFGSVHGIFVGEPKFEGEALTFNDKNHNADDRKKVEQGGKDA